ncbi:MAG TPA: DUF4870 domain-containing protein [Streptosporangiaceae bacterium]|nr:DUF4870 domain-containing protein [Streptosporangiaceae bacterium]
MATDRTQPPAGRADVPARSRPGESREGKRGAAAAGKPASGPHEHHEGWIPGRPGDPGSRLVTQASGGVSRPGRGLVSPDGSPVGPDGTGPGERGPEEEQWATFSYLGSIFLWLLAPLVIYVAWRKASGFVRSHAAQAFNLTLTGTLFALSCAIVGALLALDTVTVALAISVPPLSALWITTMVYLVRAAIAARRGEFYKIPGWLCVPMLK